MKNIRSFAIIDYVKAKRYASLDELMRKFGVSSATITSTAVKTALKNCIAQAKGEAVNSGSVKPQVASDGAFIIKDIYSNRELYDWKEHKNVRKAEWRKQAGFIMKNGAPEELNDCAVSETLMIDYLREMKKKG